MVNALSPEKIAAILYVDDISISISTKNICNLKNKKSLKFILSRSFNNKSVMVPFMNWHGATNKLGKIIPNRLNDNRLALVLIRLHTGDNEVLYCTKKQIRPSGPNVLDYLHISLDYTVVKETNPAVPEYIWNREHIMIHPPWGTQPRKNMTTVGKNDTSDLMMIIRRVIDIFSRSPKLKWASSTHTTPHIAKYTLRLGRIIACVCNHDGAKSNKEIHLIFINSFYFIHEEI